MPVPVLPLVAAFVALTPLALWAMRRDYRAHRRLRAAGFALMTAWLFLPHLTLDVTARVPPVWGVRAYVGLGVMVAGAALLVVSLVAFRSLKKAFAQDVGVLTVTGPYRWSRNPQYVAWFLFVAGYAVLGWTPSCALPLAMLASALVLIVRVEEEHLARTFGDGYRAWCARVPRWIGRPRPETP